jgi:hypothetical protein
MSPTATAAPDPALSRGDMSRGDMAALSVDRPAALDARARRSLCEIGLEFLGRID